MDLIAVAVLLFVGALLLATDFRMYRQWQSHELTLTPVAFTSGLVLAYYLSLGIVLL